jgi:hypothetical protein
MKLLTPAFALTAALAFTGCSVSVGGDSIEAADLADQVASLVEENYAETVDAADCPEDLAAEVDAATTCTIEVDGETVEVEVVVTDIVDGTASFSVEVIG